MIWDPLELDCLGHFGYGTGWFYREGAEAARTRPEGVPAFCGICRAAEQCLEMTRDEAGERDPLGTARFHDLFVVAQRSGLDSDHAGGWASSTMAEEGHPDPVLATMQLNTQRGMDDRTNLSGGST